MTNSYDIAHGLSQVHPGPEEPVEIAQQDDTLARTGNTARDQEMYAAGLEKGEENAKHNAAIRAGVPDGWKLVPIEPTNAMVVEGVNAGLKHKDEPYFIYAAMLNAAPAAPSVATAGNPQPARDWELTCHECDGSGHVYVKHQVAERKTDVQEFKEECEGCEGRGFVFAFQDIPGIDEYVKACRPAPAAPGVSTVEDAQAVAWMEPGIDVPVTNEYRNKTPLRQAKYCVPLYKHAPVNAPAAGDALDAARWRFVRRKLCLTGNGDGTCAMHAINLPASIPGWPEPGDAVAEFCDAAIDAALAAQRKGDA